VLLLCFEVGILSTLWHAYCMRFVLKLYCGDGAVCCSYSKEQAMVPEVRLISLYLSVSH